MFTIICKAKRHAMGLKYLNNVELNLNSRCKMITKRTQKIFVSTNVRKKISRLLIKPMDS
jgi:hypothetical protein